MNAKIIIKELIVFIGLVSICTVGWLYIAALTVL